MVQIAVRAHLVSDSDALHVNDLRAGKLISVLDWTLTDLLVTNCIVHSVLNCPAALRFRIKFISFVGVLVTLYIKRNIQALRDAQSIDQRLF